MSSVDQYILGNGALYERLCQITEVLGKFVASAPAAIELTQLARDTGRPVRDLQKLCATLCREQLLRADPERPHSWTLACEASRVTLEDAFRCAMAEKSARMRSRPQPEGGTATSPREVDLLVMQATMGINQSVFQHLRQFSLDRLKMTAAGMLPSRRGSLDAWPYPRLSFG